MFAPTFNILNQSSYATDSGIKRQNGRNSSQINALRIATKQVYIRISNWVNEYIQEMGHRLNAHRSTSSKNFNKNDFYIPFVP